MITYTISLIHISIVMIVIITKIIETLMLSKDSSALKISLLVLIQFDSIRKKIPLLISYTSYPPILK
jgi:hypothetical protein